MIFATTVELRSSIKSTVEDQYIAISAQTERIIL